MKKPRVEASKEVLAHVNGSEKVRVYRNLHKGCYSVKQGGIVRCHADNVVLYDCKFIVSKAGQRRVRDEKKKNVHAYVEGYVVNARKTDNLLPIHDYLYYNPYKCEGFTNNTTVQVASSAEFCDLDKDDPTIIAWNVVYPLA
jgi:hypothetical protein